MSFFDHIYGSAQEGRAFIYTLGPEGKLNSQSIHKWPSDSEYLKRYCEIRDYEDVYYSVSIFSGTDRIATDSGATSKVVWADADICPPEAFRLPPSIIVQTSPAHPATQVCEERDRTGKPCTGHFHVLWELDRAYPAQEVEQVARRVSYAHYDEGCDRGWTLTKILRVPGTSNTKHNPPFLIPEPEYSGVTYTLEEIENAYSDIDLETIVRNVEGDAPEPVDDHRLGELEELLAAHHLDNLYLLKPGAGESWSERQYRLELELFRLGLTDQEVFSLALNSASNKYNHENAGELTQTGVEIPRRRDPDGVTWREVQKARREYETEVVIPQSSDASTIRTLSFLSSEDRKLLEDNPTFIDDYVEWALIKSPDHAVKFSKTLAWMVLSSCYGNRAAIRYSWGKKYLNMWAYIMAGSSKDHKSTAVKIMTDVLRGVETQTGEKVLIDADFTAEGLTQVLSARDGEMTTVVNDEVQEFFHELNMKQYRSGTKGRLNRFFDGKVPQVIRSTKGSGTETEASTIFNFLGVGIYEHSTRNLKQEDFESGFLFRSVWSIAEPRPYEKGDSDEPTNYEKATYSDEQYRNMVKALKSNMSRYDKGRPLILEYEPDSAAEDRVNNATHAMITYAQKLGNKALETGANRLRTAIAVSAALLSYHNRLDYIGEFEVMVALQQAESWFTDFQKVLADVNNSDFGRTCDEVETYIASGSFGSRANSEIYRKFKFRPAEYNEVTQSLRMQGRIRQVKDRPGQWEVLM